MSEHRSLSDRIVDRTTTGPRGFSRYDLVLVAIPVAYLLATIGGSLFGALRLGLTAASVVAGLIVLDALFLHPPLRRGGRGGDLGGTGGSAGGGAGGGI